MQRPIEPRNPEVCPKCDSPRPPRANFCPRCGSGYSATGFRSVTRHSSLLERWRQLDYSMTRKEIRRVLGEPKRIEPPSASSNEGYERWIYEYEALADSARKVAGELRISVSESRLITWMEPDWDAV